MVPESGRSAVGEAMSLTANTARQVIDKLVVYFTDHGFDGDIYSSSRTDEIATRRAEAMYVLRCLGMTFSEIGLLFDRDRTTVMSACHKISERIESHVGYEAEVDTLIALARSVVFMRMRERLEDEREGIAHHFRIVSKKEGLEETEEIDGYLHVNQYRDGRPGELFVKVGKHGDMHAGYDAWAISTSIALQSGASVDNLFQKFVGYHVPPFGPTTNEKIPRCTSVYDYVARYVLDRWGAR
jgi:hypothetical protein